MSHRHILIGACGAANVVNLPRYLVELQELGDIRIRIILTRTADAMIPARTVSLYCDEVLQSSDTDTLFSPGHTNLARWADCFAILPATANCIATCAQGFASDLLSTTVLAFSGPILFFPSMNNLMWERASVQRNIGLLREDGHEVVEPIVLDGYELASRSRRPVPSLPQPQQVAKLVNDHLPKSTQPSPESP